MEMSKLEKVIKWFEYDYLPRVGAYRKDCKQGCDACMPIHDGDNYCDIDMLCKILTLLKEKEEKIKNRDESLEKAREEIKWLRGMLKEQETVVRCRDCKNAVLWVDNENYHCLKEIGYNTGVHEQDWFCADGERRE